MRIKWLGHSCVLITTENNKKILIDPFKSNATMKMWPMRMKYEPVNEEADILLITHNHPDHNNLEAAKNPKVIIREAGQKNIEGIEIIGVETKHANFRTKNIVFFIKAEEITVCHVGDLGHLLDKKFIEDVITKVDILFVPLSGFPGPSLETAMMIINQIQPKIVVPIHYRTPQCDAAIFKKPDKVYEMLRKNVSDLVFLKENIHTYTKEELEKYAETIAHIFTPYFTENNKTKKER
ncbi:MULTISPECIES: MBL fold metallo-hydrolase [unclassified Petrotoga]|uniref:MBL fold metallo-hydrolase n=1 Tax=unclassified Petrotoga TaxID=2620614 RepID=UPI000CA081FB|nr:MULTISPECIES: MBL fold metallo-hydrolase [unclassified Petrotoga]PNR91554.1 hypothetical protein X926_08555 [Petrotoga sp. HWHPT.55.6.3]